MIIEMEQFPITQADDPGSDIEDLAFFSESFNLLNDGEFKSWDKEW
jgi:hypothetical protein